MNKKIVTLIIVILISFCFLSIVVADNTTQDDNKTTDHDKTIDKDNPTDNNQTTDKNKTDNKPKNNYILAKGNGNYIAFSDGFIGFILDYSKPPASSGDEFKHVSTSTVGNSNTLKLAIIECFKQNSANQIEKIIADFVKTGSSSTPVGASVAASHEKISDHEVVKINDNVEGVFDFEVLKSVSGNESDYFAYKVSFKTIDDSKKDTNNATSAINTPNIPNATNITNITPPIDNETNATFLNDMYDYFALLANALYDSWKPIIDMLINGYLMFINTLEEFLNLFKDFIKEIHTLVDVLEKLLEMLGLIWETLDGILKILCMILTVLEQLLNLIGYIFEVIVGLITTIISILQQILGLLSGLINFIIDIINQIMSLIQASLKFLKSSGNLLINTIENAVIIITSFVIITIGAFIYNRIRKIY